MAVIPAWLAERLRRTAVPEPRRERGEPEYDGGVRADDPVEAPTVKRTCPDPDCDGSYLVWEDVADLGEYAIPAHVPASCTGNGSLFRDRCWLSGVSLKEARAFVAIREADGGRIKTAAHP
jgi:hypothetical protein